MDIKTYLKKLYITVVRKWNRNTRVRKNGQKYYIIETLTILQ